MILLPFFEPKYIAGSNVRPAFFRVFPQEGKEKHYDRQSVPNGQVKGFVGHFFACVRGTVDDKL